MYLLMLSLVITFLSNDLSYWVYDLNYSHWRRDGKATGKDTSKSNYIKESVNIPLVLCSLIPGINLVLYMIDLANCSKNEFKFSNKTVIEDVVNRGKGVNVILIKGLWKMKKNTGKKG